MVHVFVYWRHKITSNKVFEWHRNAENFSLGENRKKGIVLYTLSFVL